MRVPLGVIMRVLMGDLMRVKFKSMKLYDLEEKLNLSTRILITKETKEVLKKIRNLNRKKGIHISMAKIVCNLIIGYFNSLDK
jgi:hypothetical protein